MDRPNSYKGSRILRTRRMGLAYSAQGRTAIWRDLPGKRGGTGQDTQPDVRHGSVRPEDLEPDLRRLGLLRPRRRANAWPRRKRGHSGRHYGQFNAGKEAHFPPQSKRYMARWYALHL